MEVQGNFPVADRRFRSIAGWAAADRHKDGRFGSSEHLLSNDTAAVDERAGSAIR
jgi:hypothetical protein